MFVYDVIGEKERRFYSIIAKWLAQRHNLAFWKKDHRFTDPLSRQGKIVQIDSLAVNFWPEAAAIAEVKSQKGSFQRAVYQARGCLGYANWAYVAFPENVRLPIKCMRELVSRGIGLLAISMDHNISEILSAKRQSIDSRKFLKMVSKL